MGLLRSALSAASRVANGPAQALEVVDLYARSVDAPRTPPSSRPASTGRRTPSPTAAPGTPARAAAHRRRRGVARSGHRPTARRPPDSVPRPQGATFFAAGDALVLYSDGLIERRREDIDVGLDRLADSLVRHQGIDPEPLADAVLRELLPPGGAIDDTALAIVRL